ncbi:MAG: hypothetical protein AAB518_03240 [Patescibacteria group bacterium]
MNSFDRFVEYIQPSFWFPTAERIRGVVFIADIVIFAIFLVVLFIAFRDRPRATSKYGGHGHGASHGNGHAKTATLRDELFLEHWERIFKSFSAGSADSLKLAVIDADKLVDDTLKRFGLQGEHMADRLEKIGRNELRTLDQLWAAHRLRNEIVHTPGYALDLEKARKTLEDYRAFFEEVGLLSKEESAPH